MRSELGTGFSVRERRGSRLLTQTYAQEPKPVHQGQKELPFLDVSGWILGHMESLRLIRM